MPISARLTNHPADRVFASGRSKFSVAAGAGVAVLVDAAVKA